MAGTFINLVAREHVVLSELSDELARRCRDAR